MIQCPKCPEGAFTESGESRLVCGKCGFEVPVLDGLTVFNPEESTEHNGMQSRILDDVVLYEDRHFWMKARRDFVKSVFNKYVAHTDKIIEIGAGTGNIMKCLMENGYSDISVGEVHLSGLEYAKSYGIRRRYQLDLTKVPFVDHFDVVGMFDVLEHIDNEDLAVKNIHKMLRAGGKVIITVPAHKWLWSKQDALASHRRRYEVSNLGKLFESNGFKILKVTSFFISIVPFLLLRRFINKDEGIITNNDFKDRFKVNPIVNFLLKKILNYEIKLLSNISLKYGGSILLVAEKVIPA